MSNPYQASSVQSLSGEQRRSGVQAFAIASVIFACMLLTVFLKRGELGIEDAGNTLIFILPLYMALGWYVTPSLRLYFPVLLLIAIVAWVVMWLLAPVASLLQGRVPALACKIIGVVFVDLSLAVGAAFSWLLKIRFMARCSNEDV